MIAGHEHHGRMGETGGVLHNLGSDLVQRLDHACQWHLPRKGLGRRIREPNGQVGAMIRACDGIGGVDQGSGPRAAPIPRPLVLTAA